ncbi:MAG TPA: ABC transporter permease [Chthonomonadaceae bacterium]|nr:ABC transporter permease [Chthonomonadaceae bacterium]
MHQAFTVRGKIEPRLDAMLGLGAIALVLIVWVCITLGPPDHRMIPPVFLPAPRDILDGVQDLVKAGQLPGSIWISVWRIVQGLFFTILVGVPLGILMGSYPFLDSALRKFLDGGKSVPPTAFVGLIILWFGIEERSKVVFLFLGAIFYMTLMTKNAIQNVRDDYVNVAVDLGASNWQIIQGVLLPGALPQIWDAIIVCNGLMWTYIVLAEWVNAQSGLGYMISIASRLSRSDEVYAGIILIALISALTDWMLRAVRKRFFNW